MRALFDLPDRLKLRLTGSDRVRFLNGQVTNDVRKAAADFALPACVLSAKGKLDGLVFITSRDDELLLDAEPQLRDSLPARLERYVIADDVTIDDVSEETALFHVTGESSPELPNNGDWRRARRFGLVGWDLASPRAEHDAMLQFLATTFSFCDSDCAECFRIEQGIPRWGRELTEEIIPVEANLGSETIDYGKGCYIGQEIISRMKMSGQTNKRLCGLRSLGEVALIPQTRLVAPETGGDAGWITSATRSESLGQEIALGYVKRGFSETGRRLLAQGSTGTRAIEVEVVQLPFLQREAD